MTLAVKDAESTALAEQVFELSEVFFAESAGALVGKLAVINQDSRLVLWNSSLRVT